MKSGMWGDSHSTFLACRGAGIQHWGAAGDIVLVKFVVKIAYAMATSVTPFGALLLNFSDVLRDPSFRSKAVLVGTMIVCGSAFSAMSLVDAWRYYELWECKGHQIVLQARCCFVNIVPGKRSPKLGICFSVTLSMNTACSHWRVLKQPNVSILI